MKNELGGTGMQVDGQIGDGLDTEEWIARQIAEQGYAQISLHDPAPELPGFAFTIGLQEAFGAPELMVMGVAPDVAGQLFGLVIQAHSEGQCDLSAGAQEVTGLVPGFTLRMRPAPVGLVAKANAARPDRPADTEALLHLLIPDDNGHFPGDPACNPQVSAAQDPNRLLAPVTN